MDEDNILENEQSIRGSFAPSEGGVKQRK